MQTVSYPRGSEWRKWDLHIHSPASILNNRYPRTVGGEPDWEVFLNRLEGLDLVAIGITDYFTIDGYKRIRDFKAKGRLSNVATILPNVEFRLSHVLSSKKDGANPRRLNLHVIFSDEVPPQDIEEHFLHDLSFYFEGNPQAPDERRKLKCSNIQSLGERLMKEHEPFRQRGTPLQVGAMCAVVSFEEIAEILNRDSRFKGKHLIVFPEELSSLIDWDGQDHHIRKTILQKSDLVFSANGKTVRWCLGQSPYREGPPAFVGEFKTLKPCVHGSDAHCLDEVGVPCARRGEQQHECVPWDTCDLRYTWIKADPTFEGLKQILYEPEERVRISPMNPNPVKSTYSLSRIEISAAKVNDELALAQTSVDLNPGLVAVIGGKGAGKTALVDLIAHCYKDQRLAPNANSFVRRVMENFPDIDVRLQFADGSSFSKHLYEEQVFEQSSIVYIAQGELEQYIGDSSDFGEYIKRLIFESPEVKNSAKAFEFGVLDEDIEALQQEIASLNTSVEQLEAATAPTRHQALALEEKQTAAELADLGGRIQTLAARMSAEQVRSTEQTQQKIASLQDRKEALVELQGLVDRIARFVADDLAQFGEDISEANVRAERLGFSHRLPELAYPGQAALANLESAVRSNLEEIVRSIEEAEKEVRLFEASMRDHSDHLNRRNELQGRLKKVGERLQALRDGRVRLAQLRTARSGRLVDLLTKIVSLKDTYGEVIDLFPADKLQVLADLDFEAQLHYNAASLFAEAQDILDNRQVEVVGDGRKSVFADLVNLYQCLVRGDRTRIPDIAAATDGLADALKPKLKPSQAINAGSLYRCLYTVRLTVNPAVTYKKTALKNLSLGQKATVLMKIYLAHGDNPIVIDSHDDHLDNEFIMEELVAGIRRARGYRQVILVSNNGNVVINSDAEQVIVATRDKGEISYVSGSLEDPAIRTRALRVLEGGAVAFQKRQQKYRISP